MPPQRIMLKNKPTKMPVIGSKSLPKFTPLKCTNLGQNTAIIYLLQ